MTLGRLMHLPAAALTMPGLTWRKGRRVALGREITDSQDSHWRTPSLQMIESEMPVMDGNHLCVAHILLGIRQDALLTIGQRAAGCIDGLALKPWSMAVRSSSCCDGGVVVLTSAWTTRRLVRSALITALLADEDIHVVLAHLHDAEIHLDRNRRALAALSTGRQSFVRRMLGHRAVYRFAEITVEEDVGPLSSAFTFRFFEADSALARRVHDWFSSAAGHHRWLRVDCVQPDDCALDDLVIRSTRTGQAARSVIVEALRNALGWESDAFAAPVPMKHQTRQPQGPVWPARRVGVWGNPSQDANQP